LKFLFFKGLRRIFFSFCQGLFADFFIFLQNA
jgi:hypothetical protein